MAAESRENGALLAYVASPHFLVHGTSIARYLAVLAFLYRHHKQDFEAVLQMRGYRRVYFGRTAEEIERQGNGKRTFPRLIPSSPLWALTNLNLRQKKALLGQVLFALGYPEQVEQQVLAALDHGVGHRTRA
jgi:negative regulator of replication initiation